MKPRFSLKRSFALAPLLVLSSSSVIGSESVGDLLLEV